MVQVTIDVDLSEMMSNLSPDKVTEAKRLGVPKAELSPALAVNERPL